MNDDIEASEISLAAAAAAAVSQQNQTAESMAAQDVAQTWYVAFVLTGREDIVRRLLERYFPEVTVLIPRRSLRERRRGKWKMVEKTVFPGYVFFRCDLSNKLYFFIRRVNRVIRILEQERLPQQVYEHEMQVILKLTKGQDLIPLSRVHDVDGKVVVASGPLAGCEGMIVGADRRKGRVKIRIMVGGEPKIVDVGAEWIAEAGETASGGK
jgi:transcriptional antiterminator NusG